MPAAAHEIRQLPSDSKLLFCAAAYNQLMAEDPFDQQLSQALGPLLNPLTTLLSRTPAFSNMLAGAFGTDSLVVRICHSDRMDFTMVTFMET